MSAYMRNQQNNTKNHDYLRFFAEITCKELTLVKTLSFTKLKPIQFPTFQVPIVFL